jgi:hypothetical protein
VGSGIFSAPGRAAVVSREDGDGCGQWLPVPATELARATWLRFLKNVEKFGCRMPKRRADAEESVRIKSLPTVKAIRSEACLIKKTTWQFWRKNPRESVNLQRQNQKPVTGLL